MQTKKSVSRSLNKSQSASKRGGSPAPKTRKTEATADVSRFKKKGGDKLVKRRIEDLNSPELLIKITYKGKKLSLPISDCSKGLAQTVLPHVIRFEKEVLHNNDFSPALISNWRNLSPDILKDYYFQSGKPIDVFRGEVLQIEPIWGKKVNKVGLGDFQIIKCIGTGGFSRVYLTRLKATGAFYALKLLEKQGLFQSGKQQMVINERHILVGLNSPFTLGLQFAFETKHFVALALQYCAGGQLFYYLQRNGKMSEDDARYCFVEILLGIQYLHERGIIYRDIKPQNIMIDQDGHLKIADFGLSKANMHPNQLTQTFCGSPQYMAPQMLARKGHTFTVDYYCLGALLYELVAGNPPFYAHDVEKIYHSIQHDPVTFPPYIDLSSQLKQLIESLLAKDPKRRLGSMVGIREILSHPWVRKLKSADVISRAVPTPIRIDLLRFNINEAEIEENAHLFQDRFAQEGGKFKCLFDSFYFDRFEGPHTQQEILPSVKSQSTKENTRVAKHRPPSSKTQSHIRSQKHPIYISTRQKEQPRRKRDLIEPSRRRRQVDPSRKGKERLGSPKAKNELKRIKSSAALLGPRRM